MADVLDLIHRHPKLWKRVRRGQIPAWQARRVAQQTRRLPKAGARWVDDQLAGRIGVGPDHHRPARRPSRRPVRPRRAPAPRGRVARPPRMWSSPIPHPGTSPAPATSRPRRHPHPAGLLRPGLRDRPPAVPRRRHRPLGERKIKALGVIVALVTGQGALRPGKRRQDQGLRARRSPTTSTRTPSAPWRSSAPPPWPRSSPGSATTRSSSNPSSNIPRRDAVDHHDPPPWMRELVILRDGHCVFPGCTRDARGCDLDHIEPYDPDGPPGQTNPDNLACLCRQTPPRQDHRTLALHPHARRPLPLARPPRHHRDRHRRMSRAFDRHPRCARGASATSSRRQKRALESARESALMTAQRLSRCHGSGGPNGAIDSVQQPLRTVGRRPATAAVGRDCGDSLALPYHW